MKPSYKVEKGLYILLEDMSDENLVYFFKDEILQMYREDGRPSNYFNNTIANKLKAFEILKKGDSVGRGSKTRVTKKGLRLVRSFSKLGNIKEHQVFTEQENVKTDEL